MMIDQYLHALQEGYLFSDKTISCDLSKFESGESNILLVAGIPASGKTTLGKTLAKKYNATLFESDECIFQDGKKSGKRKTPDEVYDCYQDRFNQIVRSKKRYIIEGVLVYWACVNKSNTMDKLFDKTKKYPIIILGPSIIKTLWQGWQREKGNEKLRDILTWYTKNNIRDMKVLEIFKKARLAVPSTDMKEYKI